MWFIRADSDRNLARWVHRVTLLDKIGNRYLQRVLGYLPTLRFLQSSHDEIRHPIISDFSSPFNHLTSPENVYLTPESARALTQLPNLQHLQCCLALQSWTGHPVTLPRLYSLHISIDSCPPWSQYLVLPNLRTLRITNPSNSPACQDALAAYMATLHALASGPEYPSSPRLPLLYPPLIFASSSFKWDTGNSPEHYTGFHWIKSK